MTFFFTLLILLCLYLPTNQVQTESRYTFCIRRKQMRYLPSVIMSVVCTISEGKIYPGESNLSNAFNNIVEYLNNTLFKSRNNSSFNFLKHDK